MKKTKRISRTPYAKVHWTAEDIKGLRPQWSDDRCEDYLRQIEKTLQERMTEMGWDVIETLFPYKERQV